MATVKAGQGGGWVQQAVTTCTWNCVYDATAAASASFTCLTYRSSVLLLLQEVLGELMGWGVTPTLAHYEHLAEAYALHGKHGSATAVLDRICAAGHTPVLRTYNRLLHSLAGRGELRSVNRVYLRLRMQGLVPDQQTIRALFKCVRMYASNVRVLTARRLGQLKPGDR